MFKKQTVLLIFLLFFPVFMVGVTNYLVDPLQIYRQSMLDQPFFWENQRYQNAGKIKSYLIQGGYGSITVGSSQSDCFLPHDIEKMFGWPKNLKLTVDGSSLSAQAMMIEESLKVGGRAIKNIFWGISPHTLLIDDFRWNATKAMPHYLYTETVLDDGQYLFSWPMFRNSINIIYGKKPSRHWVIKEKNNLGKLNYWMTPKRIIKYTEFEESKLYKKLFQNFNKTAFLESNLHEPDFRDTTVGSFAVLHLLEPIVKKNENIQFKLVLLPRAYLGLNGYGEKGLRNYLLGQASVVTRLSQYENVKIYGFEDTAEIGGNLAHYRDQMHYHSGVNYSILKSIQNSENRLNNENINAYLNKSYNSIMKYNPVMDYENMIPFRLKKEQNLYEKTLERKIKNG